ncbi:MAG: hypothetical protein JWL95_3323 [Gemmatimonadetes bacterium]|nr:hypothetical protein [Gemmatimonadota bacterium]
MRFVAPRTGATEITIAEEQPEYMPVTVAVYQFADGTPALLVRVKPSAEERARIAAGADVYVMQLGNTLRPMNAYVGMDKDTGPEGWRIPEDLVSLPAPDGGA